jgi:hypothetical protein
MRAPAKGIIQMQTVDLAHQLEVSCRTGFSA